MKKATLIAAVALFGSFVIAQEQQLPLDNLVGDLSQKKIAAFSTVFKETSAKYAADYKAFVESYKTSNNKFDLIRQYLPKFEKAYEDAKAENVAEESLTQKEKVLAETKSFITALQNTVARASNAPLDALVNAVSQEKVNEFSTVFKETSAKYAEDYKAFVKAYKTSQDKVDLVKQYLPKIEKAYEDAMAETVSQENSNQKFKLLMETKGLITALKGIVDSATQAK